MVAIVVDLALLNVFGSMVLYLGIGTQHAFTVNPDTGQFSNGTHYSTTFVLAAAIIIVVELGYFTFLNGSPRGQTVGKMFLRIAVRDAETGGSIGHSRALLRICLMYLFLLAYLIPFVIDSLWPLWEPRSKSLHDMAARSIVVSAV